MYKHFKEAAGNILSWEKPDIKLYTNFKTEITLQRFWNHEIEKEIYTSHHNCLGHMLIT